MKSGSSSPASKKGINFHFKTSIALTFKTFSPETLEKSINLLVYGVNVLKHYKSSKLSHNCTFYILEDDNDFLQWISPIKPYSKSRIDLKAIKNITEDPSVAKLSKKFKKPSKMLFISYEHLNQNLLLILKFKKLDLKLLFWQGIQHLSRWAIQRNNYLGDTRKILAKKLFLKADKDGNKLLNMDEIKVILMKLHIEIKQGFLDELFSKYDKDKNNAIDINEFQNIIDDISLKKELKGVFIKYCKEAQSVLLDVDFANAKMTFLEFQEFLLKEQKQGISLEDFDKMLYFFHNEQELLEEDNMYESHLSNKKQFITFSEFCSFIFSRNNQLFDPEKLEIYQKMTYPMTDYYINTSHNTYLLTNQLTGESSTKAYIDAFNKGCRCVELDCWEGEKGEPMIYHGHTLTSKILFQEVINTIKDYAFANNPYPVILSLENHCKNQQNERIAEILKNTLGESLFLLPENYSEYKNFPSPEELKYKILVKDKCNLLFPSKTSLQNNSEKHITDPENFDFDDDESYIIKKDFNFNRILGHSRAIHKKFISFDLKQMENSEDFVPPTQNYNFSSSTKKNTIKILSKDKNTSIFESSPSEKIPPKEKTTPALKKLLSLFGIKLSLTNYRSIWNISSIKEAVFEKFAKNNEDALQDFLRTYFLRVYPSPIRVNSSNFDPIEAFNFGVQMTALNFQTNDINLLIYLSKFLENGGISCGYVLKPSFLRYESPKYIRQFFSIQKILYLEVISGQQLRPEDEEDVRDVVDPYVEVSLRGSPIDEKENSKVFKSVVVQNNGFNPQFNLKCQFKLSCPDLAFIIFKVFDEEVAVRDLKIGWSSVSFSCLRPGFRFLPMLNSNLNEVEFAGLLCYVELKEVISDRGWEDS